MRRTRTDEARTRRIAIAAAMRHRAIRTATAATRRAGAVAVGTTVAAGTSVGDRPVPLVGVVARPTVFLSVCRTTSRRAAAITGSPTVIPAAVATAAPALVGWRPAPASSAFAASRGGSIVITASRAPVSRTIGTANGSSTSQARAPVSRLSRPSKSRPPIRYLSLPRIGSSSRGTNERRRLLAY
jgi:hypothetical protein